MHRKATRNTMYICICNAVTECQVRQCAQDGAKCVEQLAGQLGVGAGCGRCRESAAEILSQVAKEQGSQVLAAA